MILGKISKKQIEKAYGILTEVQNMIKNGDGTDSKFLDASNRFFTLIPHDFGLKTPPILNEPDYIKSKIEMLDSLLEIEVAYKLLKVYFYVLYLLLFTRTVFYHLQITSVSNFLIIWSFIGGKGLKRNGQIVCPFEIVS